MTIWTFPSSFAFVSLFRVFQCEPAPTWSTLQSDLLAGLLQQLPEPHHLPLLQPRIQACLHPYPPVSVPSPEKARVAGVQLPLLQLQLLRMLWTLAQRFCWEQLQLPERQPAHPAFLGQPQPQLSEPGPPTLPWRGHLIHLGGHYPSLQLPKSPAWQPLRLSAGKHERGGESRLGGNEISWGN